MPSAHLSNLRTELTTREVSGEKISSCVPRLVAEQAVASPEAIAVCAGQDMLAYGELDRRANCLANYLRSLGVARDTAVGLYLERSPAMVVTALAILKAGGAYIPLDPLQPVARLAFMLRDSDARVVVSTTALAQRLSPGPWQVVALDGDAEKIAAQPQTRLDNTMMPADLAYIIYTSGSTGEPKGVEVPHSGLSNLVAWHRRVFQVTSKDRASALASLGFDAAVWELWPYLASGASVHIPEELVRSDAKPLRDWMVSQGITVSFAATAMAESLMQLDWPKTTALRFLLTGADTLKKYPSPRLPFVLINNYGPTEGTVVSTSGPITPDSATNQPPSIGRPIDGVQIYILDDRQQPVAGGATGEIYIGGVGLARGYRNRPDLTTERFVPNPFSAEAGARLYRTGDLARWLPDGQIAFLGRVDEQVKIRGYRVEPSEIATVLGQHTAVRTSVVVAREDLPGEKELVAYVVLAPDAKLNAGELRDHLRKRLPDYMVPAEFVSIPKVPVTANGKLDRSALPAPKGPRPHTEVYVEPRTPVEEELVKILAPLLKLQRVGVNDNFFLLGGHSLLGTQLIARISETFGVELTLLKLFDHPTVAEMSSEIEELILAKLGSETDLSGDRNRSVV
jgi:amino acid adenylation domain-containing protein